MCLCWEKFKRLSSELGNKTVGLVVHFSATLKTHTNLRSHGVLVYFADLSFYSVYIACEQGAISFGRKINVILADGQPMIKNDRKTYI